MRYGDWHIEESTIVFGPKYDFWHDGFDGAIDAEDNRYGSADTIEECKEMIKDIEDE